AAARRRDGAALPVVAGAGSVAWQSGGSQTMKKAWIAAVVILIGVLVAVARRGGAGTKDLGSSLIVAVKRGDLPLEVIETGKVQPREKVEVKSKVAGQVERVFVQEGAQVKRGQPLLRLDPTDFRRDVARTEAEVARAEADVAQAKNALEFAKLSLER